MSNDFYIGQKVICIDNSLSDLVEFDIIYTVRTICGTFMCLNETPLRTELYFKHRFVDAEKYLYNKEFNNELDKIINEN